MNQVYFEYSFLNHLCRSVKLYLKIDKLKHNLNIIEDGQGGLLEVLYKNQEIFVSYSENRGGGKSSTSVAKASINNGDLNFKNIF